MLINRVEKLENSESNSSAADKKDLLTELEERRVRAHNVITFGLQQDLNGKSDADSTRRIGKSRDNEPVPLKVPFASRNDALFVLRNKEKLSKYKLSVKNDKMPSQQEYIKSLQSELDTRIASGEKDLRIKYEKGVPRIVKAENQTKKQKKIKKN